MTKQCVSWSIKIQSQEKSVLGTDLLRPFCVLQPSDRRYRSNLLPRSVEAY